MISIRYDYHTIIWLPVNIKKILYIINFYQIEGLYNLITWIVKNKYFIKYSLINYVSNKSSYSLIYINIFKDISFLS